MRQLHFLSLLVLAGSLIAADGLYDEVTQGALRAKTKDGKVIECPLKHTAITAEIAGMVAQVEVVQTFVNPFAETIEAVYVFPLSHEGGINGMTMEIGDKRIVGALLRRDDARKVYEKAKAEGKTASLLDQERPNIFTQTVGNLSPKGEVRIRIAYVDRLAYDRGAYEFQVPLVVGPRYIPGEAISAVAPQDPSLKGATIPVQVPAGPDAPTGTGWSPDTDRVEDASRITPPVLKSGFRNGHDVSIRVTLDAGLAIKDLASANHQVTVERLTSARAVVTLKADDAIPNKDFVLRYAVAGARPEVAEVSHVAADGGYLLLMLQPAQLDAALAQRKPRDLCFLVDVSGSMSGEPLAKVREALKEFLTLAGAQDRIQVITFASGTAKLFPAYVPVTPDNLAKALAFSENLQGGGGTEMLKGIQEVLADPPADGRMRMAVMLTDGFIGNEKEIIAEVGRRSCNDLRFWCVGIGSAPNRYLIDGVAQVGDGMGVVLGLKDDSRTVVDGLMSRIQQAQLDHVAIDWGGLAVTEVVPAKLPSLWSGRPVEVSARFAGPATGTVTVSGNAEGAPLSIPLRLELPAQAPANRALRTLWARQKLGELRQHENLGNTYSPVEEMTALSLKYSVMTEYTSFVAVDEKVVNPGGKNRPVNVAVPLPEGVTELALPVLSSADADACLPMGREEAVGNSEMGGQGAFMAIGAGGGASGMFGSRTGGGRRRALAAGGGSRNSESAVDASLRFLHWHQSPDGAWDPVAYPANCTEEGPKCEAGQGGVDDRIAVTAQAVLCYLGAGYDQMKPNKFKVPVSHGLTWLLALEQADGGIGATVESQALATTAFAEAYAMTNDPALKEPVQRAVKRLLALRLPGADGKPLVWGDPKTGVFATAATASALMALKDARAGGLDIDDGLERGRVWWDSAWKAANPGWEKLTGQDVSVFPAIWSAKTGAQGEDLPAGVATAAFLGHRAGEVACDSLANTVLAKHLPTATTLPTDLRAIYLGHLGLFQHGGETWMKWKTPVRDLLAAQQRKDKNCFYGSWDPQVQTYAGKERGRLQSTVYAVLSLEVYYAYEQVTPKPPATPPPAAPPPATPPPATPPPAGTK